MHNANCILNIVRPENFFTFFLSRILLQHSFNKRVHLFRKFAEAVFTVFIVSAS